MSLKSRLDRLERAGPAAFSALDELLASVAAQGLRIGSRPADLGRITRAGWDNLGEALAVLRQAPSLSSLPRGASA